MNSAKDSQAAAAGIPAEADATLSNTARALDEIAQSTCLMALDMTLRANEPAKLGKSLMDAARDVRQLARRTAGTLTDLEATLRAIEAGQAGVTVPGKPSIDDALQSFCR